MTENEFDEALAGELPVIALFTAPAWCIPCQRLEPHWNSLVDTLDNYNAVKVDCGESPEDTADHWATKRFGIRGVPQIYVWPDNDAEPVVIKGRTVVQIMHELGH